MPSEESKSSSGSPSVGEGVRMGVTANLCTKPSDSEAQIATLEWIRENVHEE